MNNEEKITLDDVKLFLSATEKFCGVFCQATNHFDAEHTMNVFKTIYRDLFVVEEPQTYDIASTKKERQKEILQAIYYIKYIREFADKISKIEFQTK